MSVEPPQRLDPAALTSWCARHLGSSVARTMFESGHLSTVVGVELEDGRRAVVKVRESSPRVVACTAVQQYLYERGFPCPQVLVPPTGFDGRVATAESWHPPTGGAGAVPAPAPAAHLLARLIEAVPPARQFPELADPLPWVAWDHHDRWPPPDDLDVDLNAVEGPAVLNESADRIRARLRDAAGETIGHLDWEANNVVWSNHVVIYDWDSLAIRPESTVAGAASAVFTAAGATMAATVEQSRAFIEAYVRRRYLTPTQVEEAWAAGAWVLTFNAKKETCGGGGGYLAVVEGQMEERLQLANA